MTFNKALLIFVCALMFGLLLNSRSAVAADPVVDPKAFNQDDPKFESEQQRLADDKSMDAAFLSRENCPSGICYKNTDRKTGFDTTPEMTPAGDAAAPATTKSPTKK